MTGEALLSALQTGIKSLIARLFQLSSDEGKTDMFAVRASCTFKNFVLTECNRPAIVTYLRFRGIKLPETLSKLKEMYCQDS
jgi:hypothetical protein